MIVSEITNKNDECYTPQYAVAPILPFIPRDAHVWCPFDTEDSNFVTMLRDRGNRVTATHIENGGDFLELNVECDIVLSNPPFSIKTNVLRHAFGMGTPFAFLIGVVGLFESQERFEIFRDNDFEVMYLNRRVSFFSDFEDRQLKLNPPFSSVYLTHRILPAKMVFRTVSKRTDVTKRMMPGALASFWEKDVFK